jgi:hypothetical protein
MTKDLEPRKLGHEIWHKFVATIAVLGLLAQFFPIKEEDSSTIICNSGDKVTTIFEPEPDIPVKVPVSTTSCRRIGRNGSPTQLWPNIGQSMEIPGMDTMYVVPRDQDENLSIVAFAHNQGATETMHSE